MTRQEPVGATIAAADSLTYARPYAAFFHSDRAARLSATRVGAAAHSVDGDIVNGNRLLSRSVVPLRRPQCGQQLVPSSSIRGTRRRKEGRLIKTKKREEKKPESFRGWTLT